MKYYQFKSDSYYTNVRMDIIGLIPKNKTSRILEIGCGNGATLVWLKDNGYCGEIYGIEKFPTAGKIAEKVLDVFLEGDIEHLESDFDPNSFDAILLLDVLEHLLDPWSVVKKLDRLLKNNGKLIISVPNIRNIKILSRLFFKNEFKYCIEGGILDITHLRFFTKMTLIDLLKPNKFIINDLFFTGVENTFAKKIVHKAFLGVFDSFLGVQIVLACQREVVIK